MNNKTSCESTKKVASIDDIITEILLDLPVSSLLRFKSVSKHWLSLITSPHFSRLHTRRRRPLRPSGLLIPIDETHPQYRYIPLNSTGEQPTSRTITFPTSSSTTGIKILQSCNGLLFGTSSNNDLREHYVYNPTTRKFTTIPLPPQQLPRMFSYRTTLAFDPSRSPHYKLVFVDWLGSGKYQMVVYSSETRLWKVCGDQPLNNPYMTNFWNGVYLNGAVYYMSFKSHTSIYLKIADEQLETIPMPLIANNHRYIYFGQSGGRLHLIAANDGRRGNAAGLVFDVYEMKKDCSNWCLRYQVELGKVYFNSYRVEIMGIVRGEREEDSFVVFNTPVDGFIRFMKYKFADKSLKMLFEIEAGARQSITAHIIVSDIFHRSKAFELIQSLSPV